VDVTQAQAAPRTETASSQSSERICGDGLAVADMVSERELALIFVYAVVY
jgi:hypothetical protein